MELLDYDYAENPREDDFAAWAFEDDWFKPVCVRPVRNALASDKVACTPRANYRHLSGYPLFACAGYLLASKLDQIQRRQRPSRKLLQPATGDERAQIDGGEAGFFEHMRHPAKTRVFIDFVVEQFKQQGLAKKFSAA